MPRTTTISILASRDHSVELDNYTYSDFYEAYIPDDEVRSTTEDGYLHEDHAVSCPHCGESICHTDNEGENFQSVVDRDEYWCNSCIDSECEQNDDGENYADGLPDELPGHGDQDREVGEATPEDPFRIGLEVEKEDRDLRRGLRMERMTLPEGWVFEEDGSLNSDGIEVVTRAYNLKEIDTLKTDFTTAKAVMDAGYSKRCGGHISISDVRFSPLELADRIKPLFPLLMALYPARLKETSYAKAMKGKEKGARDKYYAFNFGDSYERNQKGQRIELRIPSAVPSLETAIWRVELISYFLLASKDKPLDWRFMRKELSKDGMVRKLIERAYLKEGKDKVKQVIQYYGAFSEWYHSDRPVKECIKAFVDSYYPLDAQTLERERERNERIAREAREAEEQMNAVREATRVRDEARREQERIQREAAEIMAQHPQTVGEALANGAFVNPSNGQLTNLNPRP